MKLFNWIQWHRIPYNVHPSEVSLVEDGSSVRRSGSSIRKEDIEKEPLLEDDVKADMELDRFLTIGTIAINPLDTFNLQDEEGDDDNGDEEESYNHIDHDQDDKKDVVTLLKEDDPKCEIEMCKLYVHKLRDVVKRCSNEIEEVEEEIMYEKLTSLGKRVTLLDLFLADGIDEVKVAEKENMADEYVEEDDDKTKEMKMKKKKLILYKKLASALGGKKGFSSKAKKLIHDGDVPPLKKLHRFMTKMMKKKIHPDMEARLQKKGQVKLNDDVSMEIDAHASTNGKYAATESVFLLPSQGIMV